MITYQIPCNLPLGNQIVVDGDDDGEYGFEVVNSGTGNADDDYFDQVVGCLQDIILDPEFDRM